MFKDLRINSQFFIFDKGEKTTLQTGTVLAVSQPMVKPQTNFNSAFQLQPEYIVDIRVKVGDSTLNFNQLPANLAIADFPSSGNQKIVVSSSRDLIRTEIETTLAGSKAILDSVSKHESTIQECEKILQEINPSFAREREKDEEIKSLREEVASMKEQLRGIDEIKNMLTEQNKQNNNPKTNK